MAKAIKIRSSLSAVMIFKLSFPVVFNTFLISFYFVFVESVPEDYCLTPLNTSDCGGTPTPVFYYYKPGSRCEIKFWRGCPTGNLFSNEYLCSHHCIGKLWSSEQGTTADRPEKKVLIGLKYRCDVPIDTSQCKQTKEVVYTYDNEKKKCNKVTYYGCPTENKFRNEEECEDTCVKTKAKWEHEVNILDLNELQNINKMLDELNDEIEPEKEDLKKHVNNSKIRPHTVQDYDEATDEPDEESNKVDNESKEPTDKPEEPTNDSEQTTNKAEEATSNPEEPTDKPGEPIDKPGEPTDEPEEPTDKPEETTKREESETETETDTTVSSTDSVQTTKTTAEETTKAPGSTRRPRRKRPTKNVKEGDVVREGFYYQQ